MAHHSSFDASRAQLNAYRGFANGNQISKIRAPTLVIAGDSDILIPPENGHVLADAIPDAEFHTIECAGHLFRISNPNETYSAVAEFLEGNDSVGGKNEIDCFFFACTRSSVLLYSPICRHPS